MITQRNSSKMFAMHKVFGDSRAFARLGYWVAVGLPQARLKLCASGMSLLTQSLFHRRATLAVGCFMVASRCIGKALLSLLSSMALHEQYDMTLGGGVARLVAMPEGRCT